MICTILLEQEEDWIVAKDIHSGVASQGKTQEEAIKNIKEALELYYEDIPKEELPQKTSFITTLEVYA